MAIQTRLARLAQARLLEEIVDAEPRAEAERLRAWFATEFLHGLED